MIGKAESITGIVVRLLPGKNLGSYEQEAIGELIVADAQFNIWFAGQKKKASLTGDEIWAMLVTFEDLRKTCADEVKAFLDGGLKETLRSSLWRMQAELNAIRGCSISSNHRADKQSAFCLGPASCYSFITNG